MRIPKYLIIGIIIYCLIFVIYASTGIFYIDDPDSYYYESIAKHIEPPDNTILGYISYNHGVIGSQAFLFGLSLVCAVILFLYLKKFNYNRAQVACLFFLFSPSCLFHNSWFARIDKNMIEIFLFCIFIFIMAQYKDKDSFDWRYLFVFSITVFFLIASIFWQGWILYAVYMIGYIILYEYLTNPTVFTRNKIIIIISGCIGGGIIFILKYPKYMMLVAEGMPNIAHYLFPEAIIFIIFYFLTAKIMYKFYKPMFIISSLIFFSFIFLPRVMLFMIPMISIIFVLSDVQFTKLDYFCFIFILAAFFILSVNYFSVDHHLDIKQYPDPCKTYNITENCVIISHWSKGHFYRNIWNETILYTGHPSKPTEMLDYLYYQNRTCEPGVNCVFLYHPDDYALFDQDITILRMPKSNMLMMPKIMYSKLPLAADEVN